MHMLLTFGSTGLLIRLRTPRKNGSARAQTTGLGNCTLSDASCQSTASDGDALSQMPSLVLLGLGPQLLSQTRVGNLVESTQAREKLDADLHGDEFRTWHVM